MYIFKKDWREIKIFLGLRIRSILFLICLCKDTKMSVASFCPHVFYWQYLLSYVGLPWNSDSTSCLTYALFSLSYWKRKPAYPGDCLEHPGLLIALYSKFSVLRKHSHYSHNHKGIKCYFKMHMAQWLLPSELKDTGHKCPDVRKGDTRSPEAAQSLTLTALSHWNS